MTFPRLTTEELVRRLTPQAGRIRMVLDTDTYNEIDDQFAVVYAMKSTDRLQIEAFYAAPFYNSLSNGPKDGMEKSYRELQKIAEIMPDMQGIPIYQGSDRYLSDAEQAVESAAAKDIVARAHTASEEEPLYVVAIGAITNVASAILIDPQIIRKIVVVWLGGHALHWPDTKEFNLHQDLHASRVVLDSGVPLVLMPCMGVTSHLLTTLSEVRDYVKGKGSIGDYLYETYLGCSDNHVAYSRVIWDISVIAYLIEPDWAPSELVPSPILSEEFRWSFDASRHFIRYVHYIKRDPIFADLFAKLGDYSQE